MDTEKLLAKNQELQLMFDKQQADIDRINQLNRQKIIGEKEE